MKTPTTLATSGKAAAGGDLEQAQIDANNDPRSAELVGRLAGFMGRNGLSKSTRDCRIMGKRLGYKDGTAVYRYLSGKPEGNLQKFETRLAAFLANEIRIEGGGELIDDENAFILPSMFAFLDQVRELGHIGVAYGPAGASKTCACRLYAAKHRENTLYVHLFTWTAGRGAMISELIKVAGITLGKGERPELALARHFRDEKTMIIIDNAMRMTRCARDFLQDFLDLTGLPIALVGNPEIVEQWAKCDQHKRRVGLKRDVSLDLYDDNPLHNTAAKTIHHVLKRHLPQAAENATVKARAMKILNERNSGSVGAIVMHAQLAKRMLDGGRVTDPVKAFDLAATQLIQEAA